MRFLIGIIVLSLVACGYSEKGVNGGNLHQSNGLAYYRGEQRPYTGWMHHELGGKKVLGYWENGLREGKWRIWYESGQLSLEENYKEGEYHGTRKLWYSDGTLEEKSIYRDGIEVE